MLGNDEPKKNVWGKIHYRIADKLQLLKKECLLLIPRGHLKSTLVTQGWVIQQLLLRPDLRVLIASADKDKAEAFLGAIKEHYTSNPKFISRFGNLMDKKNWTQTSIDLLGKKAGSKEASITIASVGTDMTSQHYDLIILDDLVNRKLSTSEEQRAKVFNFYMDCVDLLEPDGRLIVVGTRWHFGDLYSRLLADYHRGITHFDFVIDEAALHNPKYMRKQYKDMLNDPNTTTLFPEKFGIEEIKYIYNKKCTKPGGEYEFSCQQMNYPVSDSRAAFKYEDIVFVKTLPGSITVYQCVDPAGSDDVKKDNDDTAIATIGIDTNGDIYNIDMFSQQVTPSGVFNKMYEYFLRYPIVRKIGLEKNFNASNKLYIMEKFPDMYKKLINYRTPGIKDIKKKKMLSLSPYVANGKFKVLEHDDGEEFAEFIGHKIYPGQLKLLTQMIDFGSTEHDDALDAQSSALEFIKKTGRVESDDYEYVPDDPMTGY